MKYNILNFQGNSVFDKLAMPEASVSARVSDENNVIENSFLSAEYAFEAELIRNGDDLVLMLPDGRSTVVEDYFSVSPQPILNGPNGTSLTPELVERFLDPTSNPVQVAQATASANDASAVGTVQLLQGGEAFAVSADGTRRALSEGDAVFQGEVIVTGDNASIKLLLLDNSLFSLSNNARFSLDDISFDSDTGTGHTEVSILKGTFLFVSGLVAKSNPAEMVVKTPVATIGVRGTTVAGEIGGEGDELYKVSLIDGEIIVTMPDGRETHLTEPYSTVLAYVEADGLPRLEVEQHSAEEMQQNYGSSINTLSANEAAVADPTSDGAIADDQTPEDAADTDEQVNEDLNSLSDEAMSEISQINREVNINDLIALAEETFYSPRQETGERYGHYVSGAEIALGREEGDAAIDFIVYGSNGGHDNIVGTAFDEIFYGLGGDDSISAIGGNDEIHGGEGHDTLDGGSGNDEIHGDAGNDFLDGEAGNDRLYGGSGDDAINGGAGDDMLYGGAGGDTILGGAGNDMLYGGGGGGSLHGDAGNDTIFIENDGSSVSGGAGVDTLVITEELDTLQGIKNIEFIKIEGADITQTITADDVASILATGNNIVITDAEYKKSVVVTLSGGGTTNDIADYGIDTTGWVRVDTGGDAQDKADYTQGGQNYGVYKQSTGGEDYYLLFQGFTADYITEGTAGRDDPLNGNEFNNIIKGYDGDDIINGREGDDEIHGGDGLDSINGGEGDDKLYGDAGSDAVRGDAGDDEIHGGAGYDFLFGGAGADIIYGDAGDDEIMIDDDDTIADGGAGSNTLMFFEERTSGYSNIKNFDKIEIVNRADAEDKFTQTITADDVKSILGDDDNGFITHADFKKSLVVINNGQDNNGQENNGIDLNGWTRVDIDTGTTGTQDYHTSNGKSYQVYEQDTDGTNPTTYYLLFEVAGFQ